MRRTLEHRSTSTIGGIRPEAITLLKERAECAADVGSAANTLASTVARYDELNRQLSLMTKGVGAPFINRLAPKKRKLKHA